MASKSKAKAVRAPMQTTKSSRIEARISAEQKHLLQRAADLRGESLSDFILRASREEAEAVIKEAEQVQLSVADQQRFVAALLKPAKPSRRLTAAAARYAQQMR